MTESAQLFISEHKIMSEHKIFIDRRKGDDRRIDTDPCRDLPVDIYHRKRRKSTERRSPNRNLIDDYSAFYGRGKDTIKTDAVPPTKLLN